MLKAIWSVGYLLKIWTPIQNSKPKFLYILNFPFSPKGSLNPKEEGFPRFLPRKTKAI